MFTFGFYDLELNLDLYFFLLDPKECRPTLKKPLMLKKCPFASFFRLCQG